MSALPDEAGPSNATTIVDPTGDKNTYTVIFFFGCENFGSDLAQYFFDNKISNSAIALSRKH